MSDNNELLEINSEIAANEFSGSVEESPESYTEVIEKSLKNAEIPIRGINLSKSAVAIVSGIATLIVCVLAVVIAYAVSYNAYNANKDGYMPTLQNLAEEYGMTVDEIKDAYGLPKDMRADTVTAVALNYMPAGLYVEMNYGIPFDMAVEAMGLAGDERVNADMRYGDFEKILEETEIAVPEETEAPAEEATEALAAE